MRQWIVGGLLVVARIFVVAQGGGVDLNLIHWQRDGVDGGVHSDIAQHLEQIGQRHGRDT